MLKKTLENPLDCKEIQPVHPKGNQSWIFTAKTDAEAGTPILWSPDAKNKLLGKDPDAGKEWRQEEKGKTEDEIVGWHHQLDGQEFEQAGGVCDGQGSLACCSSWGRKELDMTERLNWTDLMLIAVYYCHGEIIKTFSCSNFLSVKGDLILHKINTWVKYYKQPIHSFNKYSLSIYTCHAQF